MPLITSLAALFFGIGAWLLPIVALVRKDALSGNWFMLPTLSFALAALSLLSYMMWGWYEIGSSDFSAALDWQEGMNIPIFMLIITAVLNLAAIRKIVRSQVSYLSE